MPALAVLGLSMSQEDVYLELIAGPPATLAELRGRLPRYPAESLDATVHELLDLGLVTVEPPARFAPVPPDVALETLILLREEDVARARAAGAELLRHYRRAQRGTEPAAPAEAVAGTEVVCDLVAELQRRAIREVRMFDAPPYALNPADDLAEREMLARGVVYRVVYDHRALVLPSRLDHLETMTGRGERPRVAADLPIKLLLIDQALALVPLWGASDVEGGVLVRSPVLVQALSALFETWWSRAAPVAFTDEPPRMAAEQRRLLALLAAGIPDEQIGAVLRLSPRTLHRRVHSLMELLEVSTRFQLGVEAARRGWL